jgi:hypothetical protein
MFWRRRALGGPRRLPGEEEDLGAGSLGMGELDGGESVAETTVHSPSSWAMCMSPAVSVWAWDFSADGELSPRSVWGREVVRRILTRGAGPLHSLIGRPSG